MSERRNKYIKEIFLKKLNLVGEIYHSISFISKLALFSIFFGRESVKIFDRT